MHLEAVKDQLPESIEAPVPNCRIGMTIRCNRREQWEALKNNGDLEIHRKTNSDDRWHSRQTGCEHFSTEPVTIYYDSEGNPIDYEFPYVDPNQKLVFTLATELVPYGSNQLLAPTASHSGDRRLDEVENSWNGLLHASLSAQRALFPPDPIYFQGRDLEIVGTCVCHNTTCFSNTGEPVTLK